jgi:Xaa-Pro aminopeptidase
MKRDIDGLMERDGLDAILVTGPLMYNPYMVYLCGGVHHVTHSDLIKKRGQKAILFHDDMERDEAAKSGLELCRYETYHYRELLSKTNNDEAEATALFYERVFKDLGMTRGRVAVFGKTDLGSSLVVMDSLKTKLPEVKFVGAGKHNLLSEAMQTKDENEIEQISRMAKVTTDVVGNVADYLKGHRVYNGALVKSSGEYLTIGDVKQKINLLCAERGAENPEGLIFAIGRDAAVPHSSGSDSDILSTGKTIVFDIYPCEIGGGYFYDFTRTWCLGYAPDEVLKIYEDVFEIYKQASSTMQAGNKMYGYQKMTCRFFEARGHATQMSTPGTFNGYIHSLSHGVGLNIHEKPFTGISEEMSDTILPNSVLTIEPGLYYPDQGIGVRIEDTYRVKPDGSFSRMGDYPYDLVIAVK